MNLGKAASINTKNLLGRLTRNLSWLFFAGLLLLLAMEAFEARNSVSILLRSGQEPIATKREHGVKIDFQAYNKAVARINSGKIFAPKIEISANPFGTP